MVFQDIMLDFGAIQVDAVLFTSPIAQALARILPCSIRLQKWGNELYGPIDKDLGEDRPTSNLPSGSIAYTNQGNYICFFFGQAPAWPVEYIGHISDFGLEQLIRHPFQKSVTLKQKSPTEKRFP